MRHQFSFITLAKVGEKKKTDTLVWLRLEVTFTPRHCCGHHFAKGQFIQIFTVYLLNH